MKFYLAEERAHTTLNGLFTRENLDKLAPERQNHTRFNEARDDVVAAASARPYADHLHFDNHTGTLSLNFHRPDAVLPFLTPNQHRQRTRRQILNVLCTMTDSTSRSLHSADSTCSYWHTAQTNKFFHCTLHHLISPISQVEITVKVEMEYRLF